jgi:copper transport protein
VTHPHGQARHIGPLAGGSRRLKSARALALAGLVGVLVGLVAGLVGVAVGLMPSGVAFAHNSLVSTDPAEGAVLAAAPTEVSFVFDKSVPLDTATITFIDPTGVRTELPISHGPSGDNVVVASLAGLAVAGEVSMRWRLVGADGHVVSGRLAFSAPAAGAGGVLDPTGATTVPGVATLPGSATTIDPAAGGVGTGTTDAGEGTTGSIDDEAEPSNGLLGWLVRFGSYLAIVAVLGVALLDLRVWPGVAATPMGRRVVQVGLAAVAVLGIVQLAVLASDLSGQGVLASLGELRPAFDTSVGQALTVRVVLAGVAAVLLLGRPAVRGSQGQWTALAMLVVAMMGTWAWTGHSRTERWPWLGVPVDIVHHSAAALWLGGLAVLVWLALGGAGRVSSGEPEAGGLDVAGVMRRFSATAMVAVIVIAVTGVVQTVRLHDDLGALLSSQHGRLLAVKVAAFIGMLAVAAGNRQRVARLVGDGVGDGAGDDAGDGSGDDAVTLSALRRSMLIDVAVGIAVLGVTASLVVSLR